METSILQSVKKNLGVDPEFTDFDHDIITYCNTVLGTLTELGIGPTESLIIEDETSVWDDLAITVNTQLSAVKTYMYLRVRMFFDPPQTSFHINAMKEQIEQTEWRLTVMHDTEVEAAS